MPRSLFISLILGLISMFLFSGCLWVEKAQYTFNLKADGSGDGTIRFINICSEKGEEADNPEQTYLDLADRYLRGDAFERSNPNLHVTAKRLFAEGDVLMGELTFTFASIDSIGFFRYQQCDKASILYVGGQSLELLPSEVIESNSISTGKAGETQIVVWPADTKQIQFTVKTRVDSAMAKEHISLLDEWKKNH